MGSFIPYYDFEYYADMSPSSQQKFSYVSNGENFILENINNSTHNFMSSIGFDFISESGLTLMTKYTRDQAQNNKNDSFVIALDYKNSQRSLYTVSLKDTSAEIANINSKNQIVISCKSEIIEKTLELCKEAGARQAIKLPVSGAFHSKLMIPAQNQLNQHIDTIPFKTPTSPIIFYDVWRSTISAFRSSYSGRWIN